MKTKLNRRQLFKSIGSILGFSAVIQPVNAQTQIYDRWFVTPKVENSEIGGYPKYSQTDIAGFSGNIVSEDIINSVYPALIQIYPNLNEWYIVRMYGLGNTGWNRLNEIHNFADTRTLADHANDIKPILDMYFPDLDVTDWNNKFWVEL